jgi:hypothetical protein
MCVMCVMCGEYTYIERIGVLLGKLNPLGNAVVLVDRSHSTALQIKAIR